MSNRMSERGNAQVWFAIVVTLLVLIAMAMIGVQGFPDKSGAITPLFPTSIFPTPDQSKPLQQGMEWAALPILLAARASTPSAESNRTGMATPVATLARPNAKTPTPIRVVVSTQKRSWVYYHGPATYVRADAFAPLPLSSFPRPANDNGRGLHWFPTTFQTRAVVDRFIPELKAMKIRWLVVLQGMDDWNMIANDYLIDRLNAEGIMVVMRIDRQSRHDGLATPRLDRRALSRARCPILSDLQRAECARGMGHARITHARAICRRTGFKALRSSRRMADSQVLRRCHHKETIPISFSFKPRWKN